MDDKIKRSATFNNPLLIKPNMPIPKSVAIIGAGTIGPDIGYYLKNALPDITLYFVDVSEQSLFSAEKRINAYIEKAIKRKKMISETAKNVKKNIVYTTEYEEISDCEFIIEAATENLALKQDIFLKVEKLVTKEAILVSNTSSIPASRIFKNMMNCDRTAVTHFFAPAWRSLPVEVVGWDKTSQKTVDFLCWFFATTGKVPLASKDVVCFMLDRIFDNWCNEAAHLLFDASAAQIDKIAQEFVYAGPFFVLNMARGNPIIFETNSLQMEEGENYKPSEIFNSVDSWLTCKPGSEFIIPDNIVSKVRDRLLGILFSQSFDIIDRKIGTLADLNLGCEIALGLRKGPMDFMNLVGRSEIDRIAKRFREERPGFPTSKNSFEYYQDFKRFVLEDDIDDIKIITIRRPQSMNALNDIVTNEILSVLERCSKDSSIQGFIITGFGNTAFSAGADIGNFTEMLGNYDLSVKYARNCSKVQCFIDNMDKPVVAAVNGLALGGGLEIVIRCHGIVADQGAEFQFPEVSLGILPGLGGCIIPYRRWPKGSEIFNNMIMLSKKIGVSEANNIGMLDAIANGYDSLIMQAIATVYKLNGKIKTLDKVSNNNLDIKLNIPSNNILKKSNLSCETVSIIVDTIKSGMAEQNLDEALEISYRGFGRAACTDSAKEGILAFLERRKPIYNK